MSKICIVGDYDSICGFGALGVDTFEVTSTEKAEEMVENLAANDYVIILITENIAKGITNTLDKYRTKPIPAIIPIPSVEGSAGLGISYLKKAVEQAVGSADMIFGSDN